MEIPYNGRAEIHEAYDHIEIIIPTRKNWFIVLFLGFWLCGWTFGAAFALKAVIGEIAGGPGLFIIVWLCGWTIGGLLAGRTFLWMVAGKEVIEVGQGVLSITRKNALFVKPKFYDLREAKNFRVQEDIADYAYGFGSRTRGNIFNLADAGTIRFDYGMKTVKMGNGLDEAEATHILQKLKDKKILTERNF